MIFVSEWKKVKLDEITLKIGSGATPKGGEKSYINKGISLIRSKNVFDLKFNYNDLAFISKEQAEKLNNVKVKDNDVLINITGASVARCTMVPKDVLPARVNQHVAIIRVRKEHFSPYYILYYLLNPKIKNCLISLASSGATREGLTKKMLEEIEIYIPDHTNQKKIAKILSDLDDKIEVNEKINKKLEEIAQTIFKHWFIDFEYPVIFDYQCDTDEELKSELMKYGYKSFGGLPAPEKNKIFVYVLKKKDSSLITGTADFLLEEYNELKKENPEIEKFIYWEKFNSDQEAKEKEEYLRTEDGKNWLREELKTNPKNQKGKMKYNERLNEKIPKEWESKPVKSIVDYYIGGDWGKEKISKIFNKQVSCIRGADFPGFDLGNPSNIPIRYIKESSFIKRELIDGDIVLEISGGTKGRPVGRSIFINKNFLNQNKYKAIYSNFCRLLRSKKNFNFYLFLYLKFIYKSGAIEKYQVQSTGIANFQFKDFLYYEYLVIPNNCILLCFDKIISTIYNKKYSNQNLLLSKIRDTLLPKLMSGELSVENLDIDISEGGEEND